MSKLALRFISGKYKGGEYLLAEGKEVAIGRSSELEIVLMEDMVSRKHAILNLVGQEIHIKDLGSTNGSFVNGEKISTAVVTKGDRILIGTSIMKVVDASKDSSSMASAESSTLNRAGGYQELGRTTMHSGARSMSGTIAEVPLPDLIQLFSTSKKTGTLAIDRSGVIAKIHLDKGRLVYATISDATELPPVKAIYRILSWDDGHFELLGPEPYNYAEQLNMPTEHILMEGLRQLDELRLSQTKLPALEAKLEIPSPLVPRLAELAADELDVFQTVIANPTVQQVLDLTKLSDSECSVVLQKLIRKNYVVVDDFF